MNDPYKVLGINKSNSDEQIKEAYRNLVKKYHPDNYAGNPLADLADEKMKEINEAFDSVMNERRNIKNNHSSSGYSSGKYGGEFREIRALIKEGRIIDAEQLLDNVTGANRNAEWHFLKGNIFFVRGWLDEASGHFKAAYEAEPHNVEYQAAYNRSMWQKQGNFNKSGGYNTGGYGYGNYNNGCGICDICAGLICADCLCNCCGGGC